MTGRWYGAPAWQLPLLLVGFTVTGWIVARLSGEATAVRMAIWFVAAVVAHDLVLFPLAAAADRTLVAVAGIGGRLRPAVRRAIVNHVRVPALGAALLFLVYLPGILRLGGGAFTGATGLTQEPYLRRWLLVSAAMFAASGLLAAARLMLHRDGGGGSLTG
jgi:triacylglycerol esterase/lipase EstA (alpha/beta hydrolase family)